jgi:hypothetical protein
MLSGSLNHHIDFHMVVFHIGFHVVVRAPRGNSWFQDTSVALRMNPFTSHDYQASCPSPSDVSYLDLLIA